MKIKKDNKIINERNKRGEQRSRKGQRLIMWIGITNQWKAVRINERKNEGGVTVFWIRG